MEITMLTSEKQLKESIHLSEYAFQYKVPENEMEKRLTKAKSHDIYGIYDEAQLAAKLHLIPFEVYFEDTILKMGGIAGVATYPEYRRSGYVKHLMTNVLKEMRDKGYSISMLHPFHIGFYRKYGWEITSNRKISTLSKGDLSRLEHVPGKVKRYSKDSHNLDVEVVYNEFSKKFVGMLVRTKNWWQDAIYYDLTVAVYYNKSNQPKGYMLYSVKKNKMTIDEFMPLDHEARVGLWNFICQHDSMVDEVEITTDEREPLFYLLQDPRIKSEVKPYFMGRIVDVALFFDQLSPYYSKVRSPITLKIIDEFAPWNNQSIQITSGGYSIGHDKENALKLSINTLTTAFFGYMSPIQLAEIGLIKGENDAVHQLDYLVGKKKPYLADFF
ncbi:GNAT family N-acetyltransferase [Bacillaceae bacterium S4-13-58]